MEIKWNRLGKELQSTPNSAAVLRMLMAHGITHLATFNEGGGIQQCCTIEMVFDYYHRET